MTFVKAPPELQDLCWKAEWRPRTWFAVSNSLNKGDCLVPMEILIESLAVTPALRYPFHAALGLHAVQWHSIMQAMLATCNLCKEDAMLLL